MTGNTPTTFEDWARKNVPDVQIYSPGNLPPWLQDYVADLMTDACALAELADKPAALEELSAWRRRWLGEPLSVGARYLAAQAAFTLAQADADAAQARFSEAAATLEAAKAALLDAKLAKENVLEAAMYAVDAVIQTERGEGGHGFQEIPGGFVVETYDGAVLTAQFGPDGAVILSDSEQPLAEGH